MLTRSYLAPPSTASSSTLPWLCWGVGMSSMNASVGARSIDLALIVPLPTPLPPAMNVARMLMSLSRFCTSGT